MVVSRLISKFRMPVGVVMVKIPANYFSPSYQHSFLPNSSWFTRWGAVVGKNIAGLILVIAGIVMLVGPGQGILTILIGLIGALSTWDWNSDNFFFNRMPQVLWVLAVGSVWTLIHRMYFIWKEFRRLEAA